MSKSERVGFRVWFVILVLLTLGAGIYLGVVNWLRYWNAQPLMNLDFPLILEVEESLEYDLRLRNTGEYKVIIQDVQLEGEAFSWALGAWSVESEAGENQILPYTKTTEDAILKLRLQGRDSTQLSTKIVVIYQYGWFRNSIDLEIKTELP